MPPEPPPPIDQRAFAGLVERHRRALHVHCYRMVGSFSDADDLVQEAMLRAWRAWGSYDAATGELGLRRWLYRIATNACLDFLKSAAHRVTRSRSFAEVPWLSPYPDALLDELPAADGGPEAEAVRKETIALGYLALIQMLPAQPRAVLVLREVLGWSAAETAEALGVSVAAANSSLQRARETIGQNADLRAAVAEPSAAVAEPSADERAVLAAFIDAHQRGDAVASIAMMSKDIRVTMPPHPMCYVGVDQVAPLLAKAFEDGAFGEWRLVPAWANRQPAAVSYLRRPGDREFRAFKIDVLRVAAGLIAEITTFDVSLIDAFGCPQILEVTP